MSTQSRRRWFELPRFDDDPNKTFMERWREHMKRKQDSGEPARCAQVGIIGHHCQNVPMQYTQIFIRINN